MKPDTSAANFRKLSFAGLLVLIIASIFSSGYNNFDEHFQILEFSNYKMGYSPARELAWEYHEQIRPALQPFVAYSISKILEVIGCYNSFTVALILRLLSAVLTWVVICRLVKLLLPEFRSEKGRNLFIWSSYFLWFVVYVGVRFSAENISGALFFLGLSFLPVFNPGISARQTFKVVFAGLLLGLSLFLRVQIGMAFIGLAVWMLIQKWSWLIWLRIAIGGIIAICCCVVIDYWFYGEWVFTPFRYFNTNLLQNKASEFGVDPFWQYLIFFFETAVPPLSIVLLILFFVGIKKKPLHLFALVSIPFLLGHFLIGHKEMRFLFPMIYALVFLSSVGLESFAERYSNKRVFGVIFILAAIVNFGALFYRMFSVAETRVSYYKYIYNEAREHDIVLAAYKESPYRVVTLQTNFYMPKNLDIYTIEKPRDLKLINKIVSADKKILFLSPSLQPPAGFAGFKMKRVFAPFPSWLLKSNINNWQERTSIMTLYEVERS